MISIDQFVNRSQPWSEGGPEGASPRRLDKKLVHKYRDENVFVSRVEQVAKGEEDSFIAELYLESDHVFFFEHPLDHYPGLMLVEAARQAATALTHIFYGVPLDSMYILQGLTVDFASFAELNVPVFVVSKICNRTLKNGQLTGMFCEGVFMQQGKALGTMSGTWKIFDRRSAERLRAVARAATP